MNLHCPLATIINFCSNDYPFLRHCIDSVKPFSSQIVIPVCDHFFDGTPEDRILLNRIYAENRDVQFIEFPFNQSNSLYESRPSVYWHNLARLLGRFFIKDEIRYILFLDCDEIVDSDRFLQWLESFPYQEYEAIHFLNYWYFRESNLQAKTWEHTPLWIKKEKASGALIMNENERAGMYDACIERKANRVPGTDHLPMFHHYSWVRTKEQLLQKVKSWSHNWQRDWKKQVEEEFSHEFNGRDFVHGYEFNEVSAKIQINLLKKPSESIPLHFSHVRRLSSEEVMKIDVSLTYHIPLCL
jgi:hypothetical protein